MQNFSGVESWVNDWVEAMADLADENQKAFESMTSDEDWIPHWIEDEDFFGNRVEE